MENKEINDLIKLAAKLEVREVQIEKKDFKLVIKTDKPVKTTNIIGHAPAMAMPSMPASAPAAAPAAAAPPASDAKATPPVEAAPANDASLIEVKSPMIGTFYRSSGPDKPAFVKVGDTIAKGDVVCIVEAMKLFNEIESEVSGEIVKVLIDDSTPVEYDQVLFLVDPS